jgi:hypothetical protein
VTIKHGWHWEFGWLRRVELDSHNPRRYAYEMPCGSITYSSDPFHITGAYLVVEGSCISSRRVRFARGKSDADGPRPVAR